MAKHSNVTPSLLSTVPEDVPVASEEFTEAHRIDPTTGAPWQYYMDTAVLQRYLNGLGLPVSVQTLAQQRSQKRGLPWKYFGQRPIIEKPVVDQYLREGLLRTSSPLKGTRKHLAARRERQPVQSEKLPPASLAKGKLRARRGG